MVLTHSSLQSNSVGDVGAAAVAELLAGPSCGLRVLKYKLLVAWRTMLFEFFLSLSLSISLPFLFLVLVLRVM